MASGDTRTQQYLDIAANGSRADLPTETCCETRTQTLIRGVAERIITEEETRAAADRVLQGEIDEIRDNPDVFDIVATKADLDAYDTSTITDNDIIRVLRDEDHNNASTYYRWDASDREFDYIGEVGDYYTKAQADALLAAKADKATTYTKTEVDTALSGKQDVLIAGTNIQINGTTISATDTTYSDFIGTDGTAAGTAGLVPAPAATDMDKYLKSDGTWAEAQGGGIIELTSADYNWPTNNPTSVALWLLEPGVYVSGQQGFLNFTPYAGSNEGLYEGGALIVSRSGLDGYYTTGLWASNNAAGEWNIAKARTSDGGVAVPLSILPVGVENVLTSTSTVSALAANQGKVLKDLIDSIAINGGTTAPTTATVGAVGTLYSYVDTTGTTPEPHLMVCTVADTVTPSYTWVDVMGSVATALNQINNGGNN